VEIHIGKALYHSLYLALIIPLTTSGLNPLSTQEKKEEKALQHEVPATLKLVQVFVTDKNGNPVVDLIKEDFQIFDKGKIQKITEFERHVLQLPSGDYDMIFSIGKAKSQSESKTTRKITVK
jgi:hypothetical protein